MGKVLVEYHSYDCKHPEMKKRAIKVDDEDF